LFFITMRCGARPLGITMTFKTDLRMALRSVESQQWIIESNELEAAARKDDKKRLPIIWTNKIADLTVKQLSVVKRMTEMGWLVYGVIRRVDTNELCVVCRTADKSMWGYVYPNSDRPEQVQGRNRLAKPLNTAWTFSQKMLEPKASKILYARPE
jgi:hypothetical protein